MASPAPVSLLAGLVPVELQHIGSSSLLEAQALPSCQDSGKDDSSGKSKASVSKTSFSKIEQTASSGYLMMLNHPKC